MGDTGVPQKITIRDADGVVSEEACMKDGLLEGETVLYAAGRIRARLQFHNGKQEGESVFYDPAGHVQTKAHYVEGKRHGESQHFSQNGMLLRKATYERGLLQGYAIDYYPSGKPREVSTYKEDVLDGEVIRLGEDGKIKERVYYERGRLRPAPRVLPKAALSKAAARR